MRRTVTAHTSLRLLGQSFHRQDMSCLESLAAYHGGAGVLAGAHRTTFGALGSAIVNFETQMLGLLTALDSTAVLGAFMFVHVGPVVICYTPSESVLDD